MNLIDYFQTHAASISALLAVLSFAGFILWGIFKLAVEYATAPRFTKLEQGQTKIEQGQADLKQGQEFLSQEVARINQWLDRIETLLSRERV